MSENQPWPVRAQSVNVRQLVGKDSRCDSNLCNQSDMGQACRAVDFLLLVSVCTDAHVISPF